jgi:predicted kinase
MRRKMRILSGLPGCGKSTHARMLIENNGNPYGLYKWARINYDQLRWFDSSGHPKEYVFSKQAENKIKELAMQNAREYAARNYDLIIDNTNLNEHAKQPWIQLANELKMECEVYTFYTPLDECLRRNDFRSGWARVPRPVIERMALWNGFIDWPDKELVLVDMDGTLADLTHRREYVDGVCYGCIYQCYESVVKNSEEQEIICSQCQGTGKAKKNWDKFFGAASKDTLIKPTAEWVKSLAGKYYVCIVSGRPIDKAGQATIDWLVKYDIPFDRIFMRNSGDRRPDDIVKKEILDKLPKEKIAFVIDDRPRVIRMWRENGLKCYDVGDGKEF